MGWYSEISRDVSKIPDAVKYFESELIQARVEVKLKGNVERAAAEMPGIVEQRFNQLQEIEAILQYLNIELRRLRSKHFKKYLENYQRALSSRDVEKYVDGESDVVDYEKIIHDSNESIKKIEIRIEQDKKEKTKLEKQKVEFKQIADSIAWKIEEKHQQENDLNMK